RCAQGRGLAHPDGPARRLARSSHPAAACLHGRGSAGTRRRDRAGRRRPCAPRRPARQVKMTRRERLRDELLNAPNLITLVRLGRVAVWVVVIIVAREFLISGLRAIAASEGLVISASQGGKWKTSLQLCGIICLMLHYHFAIDYFFGTVVTDFQAVGSVILYLSLFPSIASAVDYVRAFYTL